MAVKIDDATMDSAEREIEVVRKIIKILKPFKPHTRAAVFNAAVNMLEARDADEEAES